MLTYRNKKGRDVPVNVTRHAQDRYLERYARAFGREAPPLQQLFEKAQRIEPAGDEFRRRKRRHGGDTLYLQWQCMIFVVQNCTLVTVELCGKKRRDNHAQAPAGAGRETLCA